MRISNAIKVSLAGAFAIASLGAQAGTVYGTSFGNGSSYDEVIHNGINAHFEAGLDAGGTAHFSYKPAQGGYQGVGVSPDQSNDRTVGEIDIGEHISATFASQVNLSNITLGLLFDGPEYGDVNEVAKITAIFADDSVGVYTLTATGVNTAVWTGFGSVSNLSQAADGLGAVWSIDNPFGNSAVKSFTLSAVAGACGTGACNNQTDYTLISVSAVPEPETYAMMLAGLGLMGFVVRRKSQYRG